LLFHRHPSALADDDLSKQDARTKLAGSIVMLARGGTLEPEQLRNDGIQTMERFLE
jgi:hypothetical protein